MTLESEPAAGSSMTPPNPDYPARLDIDHPPNLNRWLPLVKWLLAIPHYVALFFLGIGAYIVLIIAFFIVLFTRVYPEGLFNYMVGFERWRTRVSAYVLLQTDAYPPFSLEDDPSYPVRLQVDYPGEVARWRPLVNWLLVIPELIGAFAIGIAALVCALIGFFTILFTTQYPPGLFNVVTIGLRWTVRGTVFGYWMTEQYPPFVWA